MLFDESKSACNTSKKKQRRTARMLRSKSACFNLGYKLARELAASNCERSRAKGLASFVSSKQKTNKPYGAVSQISKKVQKPLASLSPQASSTGVEHSSPKVPAHRPLNKAGEIAGSSGAGISSHQPTGNAVSELGRALSKSIIAQSGLRGAGIGAAGGSLLGLVEQKEDDESRIKNILKRLMQGGVVGGGLGAAHGHGFASGARAMDRALSQKTINV